MYVLWGAFSKDNVCSFISSGDGKVTSVLNPVWEDPFMEDQEPVQK